MSGHDLNSLRRLSQAQPLNLEVQVELIQAWLQADKPAQALETAHKAEKHHPESGWIKFWAAQARLALGDWGMALEDCKAAIALEPEEPSFWAELGRLLLQRGDAESALQAWEEAMRLGLDPTEIATSLGLTLVLLQRFDEAVALWEQHPASLGQDAAAWDAFGLALGHQHRVAEALQAAAQAVELAPQEAAYWNNLGNLHGGMQQIEQAQTAYQTALAHLPEHREALYNLAELKFQYASPEEAIPLLQRLLALQPDDEEAWTMLATAQETSAPLEAIRSYERLFQQGGGSLEQRLKLAELYHRHDQVQKEIIFRQLLQQQAPHQPENALGLGRLQLRQGRLQAAFELFTQPATPLAEDWFVLGQAFAARGDKAKELDCLEATLKQDPQHRLAWARLAHITLERGLPEQAYQLWGRSNLPLEPGLAWDLFRANAALGAWHIALNCLDALLPLLALAPAGWRKIWRSMRAKGETQRLLAWMDRQVHCHTNPPALRLGLAAFLLQQGELAGSRSLVLGLLQQGQYPALAAAQWIACIWAEGDREGAIAFAQQRQETLAWLQLAHLACQGGDWPLARQALEAAPAPGQPQYALLQAWVSWAQGEQEAALEALQAACRQSPWRGDLAAKLAAWQWQRGHKEQAQATLQQALRQHRREPELWSLQAAWALEQGQRGNAFLPLGRALALAPQDPELRRLRNCFRSSAINS